MKRIFDKFLLIILIMITSTSFADIHIDGRLVKNDILDERIIISASKIPNYRQELRDIIRALSEYKNEKNPNFIIAVKGGEELFLKTAWEEKLEDLQTAEKNNDRTDEEVFLSKMFNPAPPRDAVGTEIKPYINSIDGWFASNLLCSEGDILDKTKVILKKYNIPVISAENCNFRQNNPRYVNGYIYSTTVTNAPPVGNSPNNIKTLAQAKNVFFMLDNKFYKTKEEEIKDIRNNNYDIIVINPFLKKNIAFNKDEVDKMKIKKIGGKRLVLAYFNLAVINENLYFFKDDWKLSNPAWIRLNSPFEKDNYVVEYWWDDWKLLISEYVQSVIRLGYDGILIDGLDYHYLFEKLSPI